MATSSDFGSEKFVKDTRMMRMITYQTTKEALQYIGVLKA